MALHLHDREALDRLLTGSHVDGLTGCLTQSAFAQELHREVRRSARHNLRTSCCFIDLDRFKRINDRHGHLQGSRVLADVATLLHEGVRCEDTLGRYGGDEFALLAPDTDEAAAVGLAERLRTTIAAARLNEHDDPIDLSIGVAQWQPGSSAQDLLGAADQALLAAKAAGGAVVVTASELERRPLPSRLRRRRPRAEDVKEVRRVRFCGRCGQRSPLVTSGRVCVKCGLGTLMLAPEDMAPTSREAFLILDEHLAVGAVSRRAESLLGVSESDALDRHIDDLLVPAATGGARVGTVGAVIAPALATADSRHVEVRLARAENGDGPYRARIGSCGPPTGTLVVFTDDHQHGR
jgi:diguanylate cyclase (GGDEF)-like protein